VSLVLARTIMHVGRGKRETIRYTLDSTARAIPVPTQTWAALSAGAHAVQPPEEAGG
jgi:hypothetical protein